MPLRIDRIVVVITDSLHQSGMLGQACIPFPCHQVILLTAPPDHRSIKIADLWAG